MTVDGADLPGDPPPTPFERSRPRRRRWPVAVAIAAILVGGGAALVVATSDGGTGEAAASAEADLVGLLADVDAAELAMLAFDDDATEAFGTANDEEEALRGVAAAAEGAAAALGTIRTDLAEPRAAAPAESVRAAYLPHLDAWVAYLVAIAADPAVLAGPDAEALILRINATAGTFTAALEDVLAAGVGPDVEKAARLILDRGFPAQSDADL